MLILHTSILIAHTLQEGTPYGKHTTYLSVLVVGAMCKACVQVFSSCLREWPPP